MALIAWYPSAAGSPLLHHPPPVEPAQCHPGHQKRTGLPGGGRRPIVAETRVSPTPRRCAHRRLKPTPGSRTHRSLRGSRLSGPRLGRCWSRKADSPPSRRAENASQYGRRTPCRPALRPPTVAGVQVMAHNLALDSPHRPGSAGDHRDPQTTGLCLGRLTRSARRLPSSVASACHSLSMRTPWSSGSPTAQRLGLLSPSWVSYFLRDPPPPISLDRSCRTRTHRPIGGQD